MAHAQRRIRPASHSTADAREVAKFAALAPEWWNPQGPFAALHKMNPVRLSFVRDEAVRHFQRDARSLTPFAGLTLVDIGCGGGLLCEPLARQGFHVLGIDAAEDSIAAARTHGATTRASLTYRCETAEGLCAEGAVFDVVLAMEIVEHVSDRAEFLRCATSLLKPGGLMFVATINRTLKSLALAKIGAEYLLGWIPPGTHDWNRFVSPLELSGELEECGFMIETTRGVRFDPLAWEWRLSSDIAVNYMMVSSKTA